MKKILKYLWDKTKKNNDLLNYLSYLYCIKAFKEKKIKGSNNNFNYQGTFLKNIKVTIIGDNNRVDIGKWTRLTNCEIYIKGSNHSLFIGDNCKIVNAVLYLEADKGKITIMDKTTMNGGTIASLEDGCSVFIGEDCMLSHDIEIRNGDSHSILDSATGVRINHGRDIYIGRHVWISAFAKILKGVSIGEDSIVGLGAILTKSIGANCIVAGVPADIIKTGITWSRERL